MLTDRNARRRIKDPGNRRDQFCFDQLCGTAGSHAVPGAGQQQRAAYYCSGQIILSEEESVAQAKEIIRNCRRAAYMISDLLTAIFRDRRSYDIQVDYTLKSGRRISRYYDRIRLRELASFLTLENCAIPQFFFCCGPRRLASTLWNSEAFAAGEIYLADPWLGEIRRIDPGEEGRRALLTAIASDLSSQSVSDRYFPEEDAGARLFSL